MPRFGFERSKQIALYGRTRIWKTRKDGTRQRYWINTRFEVRGKGRNLAKVMRKIMEDKRSPKERYVKVGAARFLRAPDYYSDRDEDWKRPRYERR